MAKTITVTCGIRSGLALRTFDTKDVDGMKMAVPDREAIQLLFGDNPDIDADQFAKWMDANKDGDLVRSGLVFAAPELPEAGRKPLEPAKAPAAPPPAADVAAKPKVKDADASADTKDRA